MHSEALSRLLLLLLSLFFFWSLFSSSFLFSTFFFSTFLLSSFFPHVFFGPGLVTQSKAFLLFYFRSISPPKFFIYRAHFLFNSSYIRWAVRHLYLILASGCHIVGISRTKIVNIGPFHFTFTSFFFFQIRVMPLSMYQSATL
ncbi:hypothetical protein L228DRAFT_18736 [Xylona heveae TC161]|uniref:Uncharacterized protein n=1 Tax=Xylona heveae (strain CBS 132557 / TC161) TaxID=1328760 RepID=A0A165JYG2_XYLHT|nr:hypothetical protein L228DRAFT_18736 [Xylona heveae TC161]KZF26785.1 hypothetical protein L228DRAFT_18736 [Xylona heveae TC161]